MVEFDWIEEEALVGVGFIPVTDVMLENSAKRKSGAANARMPNYNLIDAYLLSDIWSYVDAT